MNAEQQQAYDWAKSHDYPSIAARYARALADTVETQQAHIAELEAQLAERQRKLRAAVDDFEGCMKNKKERCAYCMHDDECEPGESLCYANVCGFEWRGLQAGKGETE